MCANTAGWEAVRKVVGLFPDGGERTGTAAPEDTEAGPSKITNALDSSLGKSTQNDICIRPPSITLSQS